MRGLITKRDVLENMGLIWREFGPRCLFRCFRALFASRSTFLDVALKAHRR